MSSTAEESLDTRIARGRERLGELDRALIDLIRARAAAARELERVRRETGGPRTDLAAENGMLRGYHGALGRRGTSIALLLLELGRIPQDTAGR
ncbi:chorismate mutase [Streptomyces sp. NPDC014983]|uniref:chorismate mutase n=1 Tax=Streptomyces sp. NPDC014983 TaxID=3364933 RepID=UPI0036FE6935